MADKRWRNTLLVVALLSGIGVGGLILRPSLSLVSLASLFRRDADEGGNLEVRPRSLSLWVDATGMLRATSVQNFGAPPEFGDYWQFQIVSLIAVGKNVKKGDLLKIDLATGLVTNETTGTTAQAQPLSDYVMMILESGGIKPLIKKQYGDKG